MWSLGVILYELCTFKKPFLADNIEDLKEKILKEKPMTHDLPIAKDLNDLISKLLRKNPIHRPSIKEVMQHTSLKNKAKIMRIELPSIINTNKSITNSKGLST